MDPNTPKSDQERIRGYVVDTLIERFAHLGLDRAQVAEIAKEVLSHTQNLTTDEELTKALDEMAAKYPILKRAEVNEWIFRDLKVSGEKFNQIIEKLHQGNIEEAARLSQEFEKQPN